MQTEKIKFGTDGWRAIIAKEYTVYNVARVAMKDNKDNGQNGGDKEIPQPITRPIQIFFLIHFLPPCGMPFGGKK